MHSVLIFESDYCFPDRLTMMTHWTESLIPFQRGRTAIVTGTGGLGYRTAQALAASGARVIIAGRNADKGAAAVQRIRSEVPQSLVDFALLDLASLSSISQFCRRLQDTHGCVDLLINNAAVMAPPQRCSTEDGFELQFGTNYLGHFALTAQLLPLLRAATQPRVVTVSSVAARSGKISFEDLQSEHAYRPMSAYAQSKLACLLFGIELQRRSQAMGWNIRSIGAHPGVSRTDLIANGAGAQSAAGLLRRYFWFLFQPVEQGALPILYAATAEEAEAGAYYGPDKLGETRGFPAPARVPRQALDRGVAERLWQVSEQLAGVRFT